jgi:hypothetical protein
MHWAGNNYQDNSQQLKDPHILLQNKREKKIENKTKDRPAKGKT